LDAPAVAKAAILPLVVEGELSDADRKSLADRLVSGLERGSFQVIGPDAVAAASPDATGCGDASCFVPIAQATGASHLVTARVSVEDRDYQVAVQLIDGKRGTVMAKGSDGCEICGVADVGGLFEAEAAKLRTKLDALASGPATFILASEPPEAEVYLDGELVGQTPLETPVIPGKHTMRIKKDGYITVEREVTFVEGMEESLDMTLEKVPSKLPGRTFGWVSLGVGVLAMGGGGAMVWLHDRPYTADCAGENVDVNGECRYLWNMKWPGTATALVGGALTTLGVAILLNSPKSKRVKKLDDNVQVGLGPGSVTVQGRF
jgi:hypothetical protein